MSNLLRWLLDRFEKATLGALLGLLVGAVVGLYPFQAPVPPAPGFEVHGRVLTPLELAAVPEEDWPLERFAPGPVDLATCTGTALIGLLLTFGISRLGAKPED